eukprot:5712751-Karenia_brevis.AAC.1
MMKAAVDLKLGKEQQEQLLMYTCAEAKRNRDDVVPLFHDLSGKESKEDQRATVDVQMSSAFSQRCPVHSCPKVPRRVARCHCCRRRLPPKVFICNECQSVHCRYCVVRMGVAIWVCDSCLDHDIDGARPGAFEECDQLQFNKEHRDIS